MLVRRDVSTHDANPFGSQRARDNSAYGVPAGEFLARPDASALPVLAERVHNAFRALVLDPEFPCVGAKSAVNKESYRFAMYGELATPDATAGLARDLFSFVQEQPELNGEFSTFIACFDSPKVQDAVEFERLLWEQLRRLHEFDREHFEWDGAVSDDPDNPRFSFSFGGCAFFVVGLAPSGDRWARTFPWPLLAFNSHDQFEKLRASGQFERVQEVIRDRDRELQGDLNPNLANFGEHTEARQYSGREVEPDWRCPVQFE